MVRFIVLRNVSVQAGEKACRVDPSRQTEMTNMIVEVVSVSTCTVRAAFLPEVTPRGFACYVTLT